MKDGVLMIIHIYAKVSFRLINTNKTIIPIETADQNPIGFFDVCI